MIKLDVREFNRESLEIETVDVVEKLNNDGSKYKSLADWVKEVTNKKADEELYYGLKNAITLGKNIKKNYKDRIGVILSNGNNCQYNITHTAILSKSFDSGGSSRIFIDNNNFDRAIMSYSVKSLIEPTWLNNNDEYFVPDFDNVDNDSYKQFVNDCTIYSIFSLQSSMRGLSNYDSEVFNIENQWFWLSNKEMQDLSNQYNFDELYQDTKTFSQDRFIYNKLNEIQLSPDALAVLEKAKELVRNSFKYRQIMHDEHPEYHLQTWDAGWYQIKKILKEYMKDDLKEFNIMYKSFADRLRPYVYEFGFLRK